MPKPGTRKYVAIIGDIIGSRQIAPRRRASLQTAMQELMDRLNRTYESAVAARFLITLGDEFQGLLAAAGGAALPSIVQDVEEAIGDFELRLAISLGTLSTPVQQDALGADGPAWHAARDLLTRLRRTNQSGAAFVGFGSTNDVSLTAISGLLHHQWLRMRHSQRLVVRALRKRDTKSREMDIARQLRVTPQAFSNRVKSSGAREYLAGLDAMRALLNPISRP